MPSLDVYELIEKLATADQIRELLKEYKDEWPKEIFVSGNKEVIISNLKKAVAADLIPLERVTLLLQESEENGHQHILYFRPRTSASEKRCRDGEHVAESLWGKRWRGKMEFPRFELTPKEYEWADFRFGLPRKPGDWILKVYGHEEHYKFQKQETRPDQTLVRYYKLTETRAICLARWNSPDLLEVRISLCDSKKTLVGRLKALWAMLGLAIPQSDVVEWDLSSARKKLIHEREDNAALYKAGDTKLVDSSSGIAIFHPYSEEEAIDDAPERHEALKAFAESDCGCNSIVLTLLPDASGGSLAQELRTVIGARHPNEVVIPARTSSKAVDYVTNQLRSFNS